MDPILVISLIAAGLAFATGGWVVFRERRAPAVVLLPVGLGLLALDSALAGLSAAALLPEHMLAWQRARFLVLALLPAPWLAFSLVCARTNYREFLRLWRLPLAAACVLPLGTAVAGWNRLVVGVLSEPGHLYWSLEIGSSGVLLLAIAILFFSLVLVNVERTLREARGTMRWRVKFLLAGVLLLFATRIFMDSQSLLYRQVRPGHEPLGAVALICGCVLLGLSLRRSRRMQVDLYVSTKVVFGSVTILLIAGYFIALGLLAHAWQRGTGETVKLLGAGLAVGALALLVMLLLSDRARVTARRFVTRHLQRPAFDYRHLWQMFSDRTLDAMNAPDLARAVTGLVSETFEALSVTIWLFDEDAQIRFGASTALPGDPGHASLSTAAPPALLESLRRVEEPVELERARGAWVEWLRGWNPAHFPEGGHRFCMPLKSAGELLGLMTLGDRVQGIPLTGEELDLFKILAEQTAARLRAVRMAERLLVSKQMEAFQLMSAFLVHDLKNTASSLSLTLQNLHTYFDDPEFRKDAERTIGAGVQKMNDVIRRLGSLRKKLELQPSSVEFNVWLGEALQRLEGATAGGVRWAPGPELRIRIDAEQMLAVVTNLVLNAREASAPGRLVEVNTLRRDAWAVLVVRDEGCGMAPEFVANKLFHPFQTTKKEGMGIGLFQSRMVVETHGGHIEVESEPGRGSTFRVLLPLEDGQKDAGR